MKIAIASDLHLEFDRKKVDGGIEATDDLKAPCGHPTIGPDFRDLTQPLSDGTHQCLADLMILAGDIDLGARGIDYGKSLSEWLGVPVVMIAGNHEFYGLEFYSTYDALQNAATPLETLTFLERQVFETNVGGTALRILGCTLWTDFRLFGEERREETLAFGQRVMKDFSGKIQFGDDAALDVHKASNAFEQAVTWLEHELARAFDGTTIVLTHHAPSAMSIIEKHRYHPISPSYACALDHLVERWQPALWVHGHLHQSADYMIGRTRVVCNPRGSPRRLNTTFEPGMIVEL